jgi:hypothetical protein
VELAINAEETVVEETLWRVYEDVDKLQYRCVEVASEVDK